MNCPTRRLLTEDGMFSLPVDRAIFGIKPYKPNYIVVARIDNTVYELRTFKTEQEAVEYLREIHLRFEY